MLWSMTKSFVLLRLIRFEKLSYPREGTLAVFLIGLSLIPRKAVLEAPSPIKELKMCVVPVLEWKLRNY